MTTVDVVNGLTFDDVLLQPCYSEVLPSDVNTQTSIGASINLKIPLISAAMDTVTESNTAIVMAQQGGLGVIHRNMSVEKQAAEVKKVKKHSSSLLCCGAIGPGADFEKRSKELVKAGVDALVLDTAHGHSKHVLQSVENLRLRFADLTIIAGNIVTAQATRDLAEAGVDAVKVGVGPGSICTTRIVAGVGVPQITAIANVVAEAKKHNIKVIADGGIKFSGDCVKALAAGADAVMIGSLFAGTHEAPGELVLLEGRSFKVYRGMGSIGAMQSGSKDRYGQGKVTQKNKLVPEGIEGRIPYRGPLKDVLYQIVGGIRSGMGYLGAENIQQLQDKACFVKITSAGLKESHVHDVTITKESPNYQRA